MILSAELHGEFRRVATSDEVDQLVDAIMTTLAPSDPWLDLARGETAELYFATAPLTAETFADPRSGWQAASVLTVSVNRVTGCGAVRWNLSSASVNPVPTKDPRVVSDPEVPYWFHPRHVVAAAEVEAAVREFCASGGLRPTCVGWAEFSRAAGSYLDSVRYRELFPAAA